MDGELRLYDVTIGRHKTQMRLNDADAAAMGAVLATDKRAPEQSDPPGKSRLVVPNKTRGTGEPATSHHERKVL